MTKDTKRRANNYIPVTVPFSAAIPAVELEERESTREIPAWANRCVWTDCMLNALIVGVRGGKWHALSDKVGSELNLFTSARTHHPCYGDFHPSPYAVRSCFREINLSRNPQLLAISLEA